MQGDEAEKGPSGEEKDRGGGAGGGEAEGSTRLLGRGSSAEAGFLFLLKYLYVRSLE